ncbi:MAG: outer membrane lipoprotein carrier protein LolA [Acidobacteria bacterium]|nr:outer membrane lipoprotein carrier protein LolA [Acidobacteriota bacterium]
MKPAALLLLASISLQARDLQEILRAVERRYNGSATLECRFELRQLVQNRPRRSESGRLILRKPGRMRWEYTQPAGKLFVCDGKWVYFYSPGDPKAEKAKLKEADDFRAPLAFLLGRLDFRRTFGDFELKEDGAEATIVALPKSDRVPYRRVEFTVNSANSITRLTVRGVDGTDMEFLFTAEKLNTPAAESEFRFQPPQGIPVEEVEH